VNTHLTDADVHRYADGELDATTRERHAGHLATCQACAKRLATIEGLLAQAGRMPAGIAPPEDLWPDLRRRIESQKLVALNTSAGSQQVPWWTRPWPALAAAAILILATASATAWLLAPGGGGVQPGIGAIQVSLPENTPPQVAILINDYEGMTQRLADEFASKRDLLPPDAVQIVDENLRIIDEALAELRQVLLSEPENETVFELLATAYRQKVSVLEHATESVS
jgi:hypothetical protein